MAHLQLHSHVGYGLVGERAVFLDLKRDRYLALEGPLEYAFRQIREASEPIQLESADNHPLLATGLFRRSYLRGTLAPAPVSVPSASLLDEPTRPRAGWSAALRAWASVARARRRLASRPLLEIVDALREARHAAPRRDDATVLEDAARRFLAARALVPVARSCLLDALALIDWLGEDAARATLVFGVRLDPFGAHCWLQTDRLLLTDARDTIGQFVPVLSV